MPSFDFLYKIGMVWEEEIGIRTASVDGVPWDLETQQSRLLQTCRQKRQGRVQTAPAFILFMVLMLDHYVTNSSRQAVVASSTYEKVL